MNVVLMMMMCYFFYSSGDVGEGRGTGTGFLHPVEPHTCTDYSSPALIPSEQGVGEEQGPRGEEELGTELYSQEFTISKAAMNQNFTPQFT